MHWAWVVPAYFSEFEILSEAFRTFKQNVEIAQYPEPAGKRGIGQQDGQIGPDAGGFATGIGDDRQFSHGKKKAAPTGGLETSSRESQSSGLNST
jgi:hypothetical protein